MSRILLAEDHPGLRHDLRTAAASIMLTARARPLMLTARARPYHLEQSFAAGASDHPVRPLSRRELPERVEAAPVGDAS
jgi:CheY-like chemotaxis protein